MDGPMLWGYFFTHHETTLLVKAKDHLIDRGYVFVNIYLSEKEDNKEEEDKEKSSNLKIETIENKNIDIEDLEVETE